MSFLDKATSAVGKAAAIAGVAVVASKAVTSLGAATGLSSLVDAVTGAFKSFNSLFKQLDGVSLPLPNPLHAYASYNYILGLGILTDAELNDPNATYMGGSRPRLICKSASTDPNNRVQTPYGKFDFYIEELVMEHQMGFEDGENTNVTNFSFKVVEPYSMGGFLTAVQQLALEQGHDTWTEAPFLLTIEFRGNKETGQMVNVPNTSRYIPILISDIDFTVDHEGSKYTVQGMPWGGTALTDANNNLTSDVTASGASVQQLLQTGEKSLQVALNKRQQMLVETGVINVPDEYLILFPQDLSSSATSGAGGDTENFSPASGSTDAGSSSDVEKLLGVTRAGPNKNLQQSGDQANEIGKALLDYDKDSATKDAVPIGKESEVYDNKSGTFFKGKLTITPGQSDFKFSQDSDIVNAINQVVLKSTYIKKAFIPENLSPEGYRNWWRVDCQVYNIGPVRANTGTKPKLFVYRVHPYNVHSSRLMPAGHRAPGYDNLKLQVVKEYNYIYTGANVDVIKFDITFNTGFSYEMAADGLQRTQDAVKETAAGGAKDKTKEVVNPLAPGKLPQPGSTPTIVKFIKTLTGTDRGGGGGPDSQGVRAARLFHDAVTNTQQAMMDLDMEIIGDPYFITQSGVGNYTASATQYANLNNDGTANYQNGEVDIMVNFRTPIDINQTTGLYTFAGGTTRLDQWSGLYSIQNVTSTFKTGQFKQKLHGMRRPLQELQEESTPADTYVPNKEAPPEDRKVATGDEYDY
jgi:hypothetical protein